MVDRLIKIFGLSEVYIRDFQIKKHSIARGAEGASLVKKLGGFSSPYISYTSHTPHQLQV